MFLTEKVRRKIERTVKNTCRTNDSMGGMIGQRLETPTLILRLALIKQINLRQ